MRLDEDKLEALRRWAQGLQQAGGEESAAAGRAILMLIAELEQLQMDLGLAREQLSQLGPAPSDETPGTLDEPLASTLHERLQQVHTRGSDSFPQTEESGSGPDGTTTSRQAWIEALRRHR